MLKCARSLTFTQMIHAPKFILGFFHSTPARFPALKYRAPKFNYPPFFNLEMTSKWSLSSSRASSSDNSKVDVMKSGVLQDDSDIIEKSTVQGIKTRLRSSRVPAKGVKHELVSTLKSSMNINFDDEKVIRAEKKARTTGAEVCASVEYSADEPWTVLTHRKPQKGWTAYNPRSMRPPPIGADKPHIKLMSWNVNGLRSLLKSGGFSAFKLAQREDFDVLCLQETKLKEKDVDVIRQSLLEGYDNSYWTCSVSKLGYSGTAIISRIKPHSVRYGLGIEDHDSEGRLVTVEFDSFYLLCGYVPNSGRGLKRLSYRVTEWDPSLSNYMKDLEKSKPVILSGDLNCAHQEIDIHNPDWNRRSAGFTDEERKSFETNFLERGFVDTFRRQHPDVVGYTFWGYTPGVRQTNKGWRLDYFLASESIADKVYDSYILPNVVGSDHCPIGLVLEL